MTLSAPRSLARFNKVVTNPIQGIYAPYLPPWAVIHHQGRRSGRDYATPVFAWKSGQRLAVAIVYGERSGWLLNALAAGSAEVTRRGRSYVWAGLQVVDVGSSGMSAVARIYAKPFGSLLVGDLSRTRPTS